ncbi:MAG: hypothetical protein AUJ54_05620 [Ignavibacteria bacterium CG1_02_37_35]|nr:MAG: hypothetical protein AUJ54_05620 [Ignavibacteria bacterium CG1_02_37_35]PIX94307.1 MAG: hypothetical protein COZ25_06230 [Ignavibacteria bacterium CG_4_10_14_3_um_filter_37_18]
MKKYFLLAILFLPVNILFPQTIGERAPDREPLVFPTNAYGADLMFGEGGFGLGGFYRNNLNSTLTLFTDMSISEAKDENEFEYVDYWGRSYTVGKKNRIFLLPFFAGLQSRLFANDLGDNFRPYINFAVGPTMVVTTPYEREFFNSLKYAQANYTFGGYIGFGANFGIDQKHLAGINIRYYVIQFFNHGIESLEGKPKKSFGGFFITLNIGSMY